MTKTNQQSFNLPKGKSYFIPSILLGIFLSLFPILVFHFVPDYMNHNQSFFSIFCDNFFKNGNVGTIIGGSLYFIILIINCILLCTIGWFAIRILFLMLGYKNWFTNYISEHTKIINSCNTKLFTDKVAMVVATCNDFSPNTILQTAKQTYKNMDVWISDDSSKPDVIEKIDSFCKKHNFNVIHRDPQHKKEHPTKIGNLSYFLSKCGDKYDYIFENDSGSIVTNTFVENSLCYFNSSLLINENSGAVITNGSFYGAQNIIGFLVGRAFMFSEATCATGSSVQLTGCPTSLNGWGCLYKTSVLKAVDLKTVECPICDSARGMYLTLYKYKTYLNPFDFAAKLGPQSIQALRNQRLKWAGGDVFVFRNKLSRSKYPTFRQNIYIKTFTYSINLLFPFSILALAINAIILACLNFFYFNITALVILASIFVPFILVVLILFWIKKAPLLQFIWLLLGSIAEIGFIYNKIYQMIWRGFIRHTWSSRSVTLKTTNTLSIKQKLKMGLPNTIILLLSVTLCLLLTLLIPSLNKFLIWINIFLVLSTPSVIYLIYLWIGCIHIRIGYDDKMVNYNHWLQDFRLKYVKQSEIWSRQHPNDI